VDLESASHTSQPDDTQNKSELFEDSTHIFIYTDTFKHSDGTYHPVGFIHRLYAYIIIFFQYLLYLGVALLQIQENKRNDPFLVPIVTNDCPYTGTVKLESLTCPTFENHLEVFASFLTAIFIVTFYILPDIMGSIILMKIPDKNAKIAAVLILIGAMTATFSAWSFVSTLSNFNEGGASAVEVFLGCVGIVFIHDLDEKLRSALNRVNNPLMIFLLVIVWNVFFYFVASAIAPIFT